MPKKPTNLKPFAWLVLLFLSAGPIRAQKEGNIWYFGSQAGLDFNSGKPVILTDGQLKTSEGCATICDVNGKLLFYTDGSMVWDRKHNLMPNGTGLLGNSSSTQSAIIVPWPTKPDQYFVFTVSCVEEQLKNGMQYSVVDMTRNSSLGDVVKKNQMALPRSTERVTAMRHANGRDIWVIGHSHSSDSFYAFLVGPAGVGSPVISKAGMVHLGSDLGHTAGYMKGSPKGNKLAMAIYTKRVLELFDFNSTTGKISNAIALDPLGDVYGTEFSHDGGKLYASNLSPTSLVQFDVLAGSAAAIQNSAVRVGDGGGAVQAAPDGRLYVSPTGSFNMHCVKFPNKKGAACGFVRDTLNLTPARCFYGLPTFIQSFFLDYQIEIKTTCLGDSSSIRLIARSKPDSVSWRVTDSTGAVIAQSQKTAFRFMPPYPGKFVAYVQVREDTSVTDLNSKFTIYYMPPWDLGPDQLMCPGTTVRLSTKPGMKSYFWSNGSRDSILTVNKSGKYWVSVTNGDCSRTDTITLKEHKPGKRIIPNDTSYCKGNSLNLKVLFNGATLHWSDGTSLTDFKVKKPGTYWMKINTPCGTQTDTFRVRELDIPVPNLGKDTLLCVGSSFSVSVTPAGGKVSWQDGRRDSIYLISKPGKYWVRVVNICGISTDTLQVYDGGALHIKLPADTQLCEGTTWNIPKPVGITSWEWQDGQKGDNYSISQSGNYAVRLLTPCMDTTLRMQFGYEKLPRVELGRDTTLCKDNSLVLHATWPGATYVWQDGRTDSVLTVTGPGRYKVSVKTRCGLATDSIDIQYLEEPKVDLGKDVLLCLRDTLVLNARIPQGTYLWQDGSAKPEYIVRQPGTYSVKASNICGEASGGITVEYEDCTCYLYAATSFSPNEDGINDDFKPSVCRTKEYMFRIYNRWGQCIFETTDILKAWDGRYLSTTVQEGVYMYTVMARGVDNRLYNTRGTVTVVR